MMALNAMLLLHFLPSGETRWSVPGTTAIASACLPG